MTKWIREFEVVGGCECCGSSSAFYDFQDSAIRAARAMFERLTRSGHRSCWVVVYNRFGLPVFDLA